jgi:hypothetical protein
MSDNFHDFKIDSIMREGENIMGIACYPLYGPPNFRNNRSVHKGASLNMFRYSPNRLMMKIKDDNFLEIVVADILDDFGVILRNLPENYQLIFDKIPDYQYDQRDFL